MDQPKISVVIPAFNEEKIISRILTSLQNQKFEHPYEVIVVDNNSIDKTAEIAQKFKSTIVKEKQQGYAYACNKGFNNAKADIVARADADYVLPPNWLHNIWQAFQKDTKLIAVGGPVYPLEGYWWENLFTYPTMVIWMYLLKILGRGFLSPNIAMKKEAFNRLGGFNTQIKFGEDADICLRLQKLGKVLFDLRIYAHSSIRRLQDMGAKEFVLKYAIANQVSMWKGGNVYFGLNPIRHQHIDRPINPSKPWPYLFITPVGLTLLIAIVVILTVPFFRNYLQDQIIFPVFQLFFH